MVKAMDGRNKEWTQRKADFASKKSLELKTMILNAAKDELRKVQIRENAARVAEQRAKRDAEIAKKKREEGNADEEDEMLAAGMKSDKQAEESSWVRGTASF